MRFKILTIISFLAIGTSAIAMDYLDLRINTHQTDNSQYFRKSNADTYHWFCVEGLSGPSGNLRCTQDECSAYDRANGSTAIYGECPVASAGWQSKPSCLEALDKADALLNNCNARLGLERLRGGTSSSTAAQPQPAPTPAAAPRVRQPMNVCRPVRSGSPLPNCQTIPHTMLGQRCGHLGTGTATCSRTVCDQVYRRFNVQLLECIDHFWPGACSDTSGLGQQITQALSACQTTQIPVVAPPASQPASHTPIPTFSSNPGAFSGSSTCWSPSLCNACGSNLAGTATCTPFACNQWRNPPSGSFAANVKASCWVPNQRWTSSPDCDADESQINRALKQSCCRQNQQDRRVCS